MLDLLGMLVESCCVEVCCCRTEKGSSAIIFTQDPRVSNSRAKAKAKAKARTKGKAKAKRTKKGKARAKASSKKPVKKRVKRSKRPRVTGADLYALGLEQEAAKAGFVSPAKAVEEAVRLLPPTAKKEGSCTEEGGCAEKGGSTEGDLVRAKSCDKGSHCHNSNYQGSVAGGVRVGADPGTALPKPPGDRDSVYWRCGGDNSCGGPHSAGHAISNYAPKGVRYSSSEEPQFGRKLGTVETFGSTSTSDFGVAQRGTGYSPKTPPKAVSVPETSSRLMPGIMSAETVHRYAGNEELQCLATRALSQGPWSLNLA